MWLKHETKCLHEGYKPKRGEPRELPIYQSTTFKYDTSNEMGALFDPEASGYSILDFKIQQTTRWLRRFVLWKVELRQC